MPIALAVICSVALTTVIVGLVAALLLERARRHDLAARVGELERLLANLERVGKNKLYRMRLEDIGFGATQAALRIRAIRDELNVVETILNPNKLSKE